MVDAVVLAQILAWVFAGLTLVKALADFLTFVASKTATEKDDKVANTISKGISFLGKLLDYISANSRPK
jgi:hypothetical protein